LDIICLKEECYGCSACYNICPTNCISMKADEEGFLYPSIDKDSCIACKKCLSVCPARNNTFVDENIQNYYALKHEDNVRLESTSGGIFTAISDYILQQNGAVVGASLNNNFTVSHNIAHNINTRNLLRGTKYVQSDLDKIFKKIEEILSKRQLVLFVGTPCQVEGLNLFLGEKYDNLLTCDLVCHGVPSPKVFKSYIDYIQKKSRDKLIEYAFRDKKQGWRGYTVLAKFENVKLKNNPWLRSFNYLFSQNYINRPACSQCKYATFNRVSDITIGDYWGVEKYHPSFEDNLGVSLVIANTEKGNKIYSIISKKFEQIKIKKEEAAQNSLKRACKKNKNRDNFWREYLNNSYESAIKKYGEYNVKGFLKDIVRKLNNKIALRKSLNRVRR